MTVLLGIIAFILLIKFFDDVAPVIGFMILGFVAILTIVAIIALIMIAGPNVMGMIALVSAVLLFIVVNILEYRSKL